MKKAGTVPCFLSIFAKFLFAVPDRSAAVPNHLSYTFFQQCNKLIQQNRNQAKDNDGGDN